MLHTTETAHRTHKLIAWLLGAYLLFVIYGSLVPLRFVPRPFDEALTAFSSIPFLDLGIGSRADWVANLLLFIPLGLLTAEVVIGRRGGGVRVVLSVLLVLLGTALAVGIEFVQLFFPQRTVSQNDILAETLGGLIGVTAQTWLGAPLRGRLAMLWALASRQGRLVRVLEVYLAGLLVFNLLPLDLTISPVEVYHKWSEGRVILVPFGWAMTDIATAGYGYVTDLLVWVPVGVLWALSQRLAPGGALLRGLIAAAVIECLQVFVYSRVTDVTDVLLGGAGTAIGAALIRITGHAGWAALASSGRVLTALWWAWLLGVLAVFWYPFDFGSAAVDAAKLIDVLTRVPFFTYYFTSEYHATNELLRRIAFFLPGGVVLGLLVAQAAGKWAGWRLFAAVVVPPLLVEAGQLFMAGKYADPTDFLLECLGVVLGFHLVKWLMAGQAVPETVSTEVSVQSGREVPHPRPESREHEQARPSFRRQPVAPVRPGDARLGWRALGAAFGIALALGVLLSLFSRLPGVPYNVRELLSIGPYGIWSGVCLALVLVQTCWMMIWVAHGSGRRTALLPLPLMLSAMLAWAVVALGVAQESLHDVVGSPVLGWPLHAETFARFCALHVAIVLPALGGVLLSRLWMSGSGGRSLVSWAIWSVLLAWPLHVVIVVWAATDNLTELMRGGGSFMASASLAMGIFLAGLSAAAFAALLLGRLRALSLIVIASLLAYAAFHFGTEHYIVKYDRVFSAFQFLLSANRDSYVSGVELIGRYLIAYAAMVVVTGALFALGLRIMTPRSPSQAAGGAIPLEVAR